MAAWTKTPTGVSGMLYGKRVWINRIPNSKSGSNSAFRISIDGLESASIENNGYVASVKIGKDIAFEALKAAAEAEKLKKENLSDVPTPVAHPLTAEPELMNAGTIEKKQNTVLVSTFPHFSRPSIYKSKD